jgi:hypothetical protein
MTFKNRGGAVTAPCNKFLTSARDLNQDGAGIILL